VAELLALPRRGALRYGMARVDAGGVVSHRATVTALGWQPGDRLHVASIGGSVVVHRHPNGPFSMPNGPYLQLPAAIRKRSGARAGEQVLIAADPNHDVLVVHPLAALDSMITAYPASLVQGGDDDDDTDHTISEHAG
jgi:hypothetical protein